MVDALVDTGEDEITVRDTVRGHAEKAAMELMGAAPPTSSADRNMFGDNFDAGGWKILCPVGR